MNKLESYDDVIEYLKKKNRQKHLLLGNGFSVSYDSTIFSYNALQAYIMNNKDETIKSIFSILNTQNFELVMQQLDNFSRISSVLDAPNGFIKRVQEVSTGLKEQLIDSITELHPDHVFNIPEGKSISCSSFLNEYIKNEGNVFTTNYDLLLYWTLLRNRIENSIDGFGRDLENFDTEKYIKPEDLEYSELRWGKNKQRQNIHYLHGALHLFDDGYNIVKEEYQNSKFLLERIKNQIENNNYPIFVTAGNGDQKLNHIAHNKYLSYCYEQLTQIQGSLITFGFNFGEYDKHIIQAINIAAKQGRRQGDKLLSIYIGIYSEKDQEHILSISKNFKCKVNLFDAKTVNIWNK